MNLYKVKVKSGSKYSTVYVEASSFSEVEAFILTYCWKGTESYKKFNEIISIVKIAEEERETLFKTK